MPTIETDAQWRLQLPENFMLRRHLPVGGSYWLSERDGDLLLLPRIPDLRKLYVECTTVCNLRCRTCMRNAWEDGEGTLSMATFGRLPAGLDALPELRRVVFAGYGEPLCHPHILDMVRAVRERGLEVTIASNGLLVDLALARELVALGVDRLVLSMDGARPETYAGLRGAALAQVIDGIGFLNEAKARAGSLRPTLAIEFVALRSNVEELGELARLAARLDASCVVVSHPLAHSEEMYAQALYGHAPARSWGPGGWPVHSGDWVTWGTLDLPRMHWGAERRCRFVGDRAAVLGWDGGVSPCYALSHTYSYLALDGVRKRVSRYVVGRLGTWSLAQIWTSEEYARFRSEVRGFHFPSCPDCDLRATCDLRQRNEGCWGWNPSCADCLWAQDIVRCP